MTRSAIRFALRAAALAAVATGLAPSCASHKLSGEVTIDARPDAQAFERARRLAVQAAKTANPQRAVELYRQAVALYPDLAAGWNNLGVALLEQQRYLEAAEAFVQAAQRAPTDPRPLYNLGLAWERTGYYRDALKHYERALARDPRYLPALRGAVRAERLLGQGRKITLDWIRTALGLERDERWRLWFTLQKQQVEALVKPYGADADDAPAAQPDS